MFRVTRCGHYERNEKDTNNHYRFKKVVIVFKKYLGQIIPKFKGPLEVIKQKLFMLYKIIFGLDEMHDSQNLIYRITEYDNK